MSNPDAPTSREPMQHLRRSKTDLALGSRASRAVPSAQSRMMPRAMATEEKKHTPEGTGLQNGSHKRKNPTAGSLRPVRDVPFDQKVLSKAKTAARRQQGDAFDEMQQWHDGFATLPAFQQLEAGDVQYIFRDMLKGLGKCRDVGSEQSSKNEVATLEMQEWDTAFADLALDQEGMSRTTNFISDKSVGDFDGSMDVGGRKESMKDGNQRGANSGIEMAIPSRPRKKKHRSISVTKPRRQTIAQEIEGLRHSIQQQEKRITVDCVKLPRPPQIHLDPECYTRPDTFVPGSAEAAQWIARTKYKYAWKRQCFIKSQEDLSHILENYPRRRSGGIITTRQEQKEIRWLRSNCEILRRDLHDFDMSFHHYRAAHEKATIAEQRRVQDDAEHMVFCLSILQSHYEQHTLGSADKIIDWNDGFDFCEGQSPWDHPELPDGLSEGYFGDDDPPNSLVDDIVDELESLMGNMHIGV